MWRALTPGPGQLANMMTPDASAIAAAQARAGRGAGRIVTLHVSKHSQLTQ